MKITKCEIVVIGDGPDVDPDKGGVEPLPILTVHTDEGISGISEMFRVPPGVARAALVGPDSFFAAVLGAELVHPEAIWNRLYEAMIHSNRRGWAVRCLGALDVALWDIYGKAHGLPVFDSGISEMFRVPPGVARAALVGPDSFFAAVLGAPRLRAAGRRGA